MSHLQIFLLGKPRITLDDVPIHISTARAMPLIAYLAVTGKGQTREVLANLLWPESTQKQALAALRTTLWRLKDTGLDEWITLDRNEIDLNQYKNITVDLVNFKTLLDKCATHGHPTSQICLHCTPILTNAIELYHGEFMAGFNISKAPTFDDWRMQQSESLNAQYLDALERLVRCHRTFGDFNLAIHYARIWLSADKFNENIYLQLMQLYSITGQRTAGISLYKHYKDMLFHQLGIEPTTELTSLYKQIMIGQPAISTKQKVKTPVLLIADIEKAAFYWARAGNKKNRILSTYMNIVKETVRRFGGIVLQKSEESITLFFENGQPLHCAVTIHLKLKKADWGKFDPPNIRMVLFSTILEGENSSNFAILTRTASSLLSISWGGQIIFTEQTLRLLDVPLGSNIKDLGFHFLNETDGAVHVYELLHPHLSTNEHPPLQSSPQQLVNFPVLDPTFIGREQDLAELKHLLFSPEYRNITLVGPGGVGKTRLAVQIAHHVTEYFPDGIFFISFTSIEDPEFIPILIADVLKFSYSGPMSYAEQLGRYLHRMKVLLVFDNFEHLRVEGAKFLALLLAQTQNLKILVTSRERLNLISETIQEVHGLPIPASTAHENVDDYSSIKLFCQNAQRTFQKFSYQNNREAIIKICQLVDGIPLSILLASSWVRVFNCQEIATEIKKNIEFLTSFEHDINPRHRSLKVVFDNSWKLLPEEEQLILRRLSIFQAAFTANAAYEICEATPIRLSLLTDKSLLYRRPDDRFEMLATFHQYATSKLEEVKEELASVKVRFCEYFVDYCTKRQPELNTAAQGKALSELSLEIENIRTAWGMMVDSDRWDLINKVKEPLLTYHVILGNYVQGGEFFRLALVKLNKLNAPELEIIRGSMQQLSAWMKCRNGFVTEAIEGLTECLQTFRLHNSQWDIAITLQFLAEAYRIKREPKRAIIYIEEALELLRLDSIPKSNYSIAILAHCQSILGFLLTQIGDHEQARQNLLTSLAIHKQLGTHYGTIRPLMGLGSLAYLQGDFLESRDLYIQALETATKINDQRDMALIHNNLGAIYEVIANTIESYHHVLSALKLCQETGDHRLSAVTLNNLAYQQLRFLNQPAEAIRTYHEAIEIFTNLGDLRGITYSYYDISKAYIKVGLVDEAWNYCVQSLNTAMTLDSTPLILHTLHGFANLYASIKEYHQALRLCYLIINHPDVESDTQKRAIVTKVELEFVVSHELIQSSRNWAESASLQDVIEQIRNFGYRKQ
jgi:predicted ATPase/DNA-binding SARP family transcriptional activator